ncbi:protein ALWAYS EARLY 2-like isoform X2 [Phalaenopsis equestris]|uniref:protein ALWAYS EARLY 2-like isoform X2 n=1 Tax=Phalaenopsis equestris TaxID=78828 RepID=UPI0009E34009|nr:protein ALWAYS EARLY 2-like isoform X2 [Phalaenopsis equestris]
MASARKSRNVNKRFSKVTEELQDGEGGNPGKRTKKRKLSDMLGSQWGRDELERFYEAYRKHGRDWRKIAAAVRNRPPEMVEALYNMNKAYLSLPEGHATAAGLIAMMTDHYNILDGSDSEAESNDASRTSRKTPKRGRAKFRVASKGSEGPYPDLLHYESASSYGCLSLLKWRRSGGSRPRAVGKRTPRIPVPFFLKEDRNRVVSPHKQGLKSECHAVDDEGVHVAALALAEASKRGESPQISQTPSRRRHLMYSPAPSGERKIGDSKSFNGQVDDDHLEGSLGSREAENGEFFKEASISETRQKSKKVQGKRSNAFVDEQFDDDREACSGTEEGVNVRKTRDDTEIDNTAARVLRPSKGSKKRSRQLFCGDESSGLDALQTLADLSLNILFPTSTVESESSMQVKEETQTADIDEKPNIPESLSTNLQRERSKTVERKDKGRSTALDGVSGKGTKLSKGFAPDSKTSSDMKQQNSSSSTKIQKRKPKSLIEKISNSQFQSDSQKSEFYQTQAVGDGKRSSAKVKRASQILMQQKLGKSTKSQECHFNASDLGRVVVDPNETAVADSSQNEVIFSTKSRNRRKMDLKKALAVKDPKSSETGVEEHMNRYPFSNRTYDLKETLSHCLSSQLLRRWCKFEWFYSAIDYPWFAKSEFVEYLNHVRLGHIPRLTRVEWGVIRSSLGKPRRLSSLFLQQEREKLEEYRESVRFHYADLRAGVREGLPTDLARPLSVGQRVIACHPRMREVHDGSVLTVDRNRCRVQFDRPELGVEFVMDVDCMPLNPVENIPEALQRQNLVINKFCSGFSDLRLDEQKEFKARDSLTFASTGRFEAVDGAPQVSSYSYPMNTLMNQAKGDTLDAIVQAKAAVNEVAVAAQQAMYGQPFTLAQIQAREADIRALADLSRTLDKKEALLIELSQMNEEVSTKQKNGDHIKDLENFRKQYAMVLLQLRDVNDQVASALLFLRQRNTYERNSTLTWNKSNETSVQQGSFNPTALFVNDSGSNVFEVIQSSRLKAKTLVDVAVEVMHALKDGEDAFVRIGEALELASSGNPVSTSAIAAVRNTSTDAAPDNKPYQDHGTSRLEAATVQVPSPKCQSSFNGTEVHCPTELISSCVATLFMIQRCTERQYPPAEVAQILDSAVASLQPCCPQNFPIFREIETCMGIIKNQMLALVPTPSAMVVSDAPIL